MRLWWIDKDNKKDNKASFETGTLETYSKSSEASWVFFREFSEIFLNTYSVIHQFTAISGSLILTL